MSSVRMIQSFRNMKPIINPIRTLVNSSTQPGFIKNAVSKSADNLLVTGGLVSASVTAVEAISRNDLADFFIGSPVSAFAGAGLGMFIGGGMGALGAVATKAIVKTGHTVLKHPIGSLLLFSGGIVAGKIYDNYKTPTPRQI